MDAIRISLILSITAYALSVWLAKKSPARASSLTAGMTILLLFTPILLVLPKWHIPIAWLNLPPSPQLSATSIDRGDLTHVLLGLWTIGSLLFTIRYILQAHSLRRWISSSSSAPSSRINTLLENATRDSGLTRKPDLRYSASISSPVVAGLFRPIILLPNCAINWDSLTLRMVLLHELSHIHRRDLWVSHIAHLNCIAHWFNPFVWLLRNKLRNQCEFAVDAQVIANGADAKCYITALCDVAESLASKQSIPSTALAMADKASLRNRVNSLLHTPKTPNPFLTILLLAITVSSTFAFAVIRPQASTSASPQIPPTSLEYSTDEVELRMSASPFPGDQ